MEVQIEDAIEKVKGAIKDLTKGIKELGRVVDADQKELQKYYKEYQWLLEGAAAESGGCWLLPGSGTHIPFQTLCCYLSVLQGELQWPLVQ